MNDAKRRLMNLIEGLDENKVNDFLISLSSDETKKEEMSKFMSEILKDSRPMITGLKEITHFSPTGEWLIREDYNLNKLYVKYTSIWSVFNKRFKLNLIDTKLFLEEWFETNLGIKGLSAHDINSDKIIYSLSDLKIITDDYRKLILEK